MFSIIIQDTGEECENEKQQNEANDASTDEDSFDDGEVAGTSEVKVFFYFTLIKTGKK